LLRCAARDRKAAKYFSSEATACGTVGHWLVQGLCLTCKRIRRKVAWVSQANVWQLRVGMQLFCFRDFKLIFNHHSVKAINILIFIDCKC
jgi:hypothetical protein